MTRWKTTVCPLALTAAVVACGGEARNEGPPNGTGRSRPASFGSPVAEDASGLSAGELAQLVSIVSVATTEQSALATQLASDALVRSFAEDIIAAHAHDQRILDAGLTRLGIIPVESIESSQAQQEAQQIMAMLETQGVDFDTAFVEAQRTVHQALIDTLDESDVCHGAFRAGVASGDLGCNGPIRPAFDDQTLFSALRSSLLAETAAATFLQQVITQR